MALGKGIPVINGFDLNSKLPLDSRTVADTLEEMNALVTNGSVTDGQLCYCKADKKLYVLKDNVWSEVGGGGGLPEIILSYDNDGNLIGDITNSKEGTYSIGINDGSSIIHNLGIGTIYYFDSGENIVHLFGGYYITEGFYGIYYNATKNGNYNIINEARVPIATEGIITNALPYFNNEGNLSSLESPQRDNMYLTYDNSTSTYKWSIPNATSTNTITFED